MNVWEIKREPIKKKKLLQVTVTVYHQAVSSCEMVCLFSAGQEIPVEMEGQKWEICSVLWSPHGVMVGAINGGVALLDNKDHHVITATFVFL